MTDLFLIFFKKQYLSISDFLKRFYFFCVLKKDFIPKRTLFFKDEHEVFNHTKSKREVPIEKWAKLLPLQFKYFDKLEKEKTLEVYYHLIGQQGSMLIVNVDSDEKLSKIIGQDPLFFDCDREIYPLTTRQTHEKQIRELLQP